MMELAEQDRAAAIERGMRNLLGTLSEEVLRGLLSATTHSLVRYGSVPVDENGQPLTDAKSHAVNSIMMYNDGISLLNKQRMKKSYIADYLNQKGVKMTMPATKHSLCTDILKYWGQEMPRDFKLIDDERKSVTGGHGDSQATQSRSAHQLHHPRIVEADSSANLHHLPEQNNVQPGQSSVVTDSTSREDGTVSTVTSGSSLAEVQDENMEYENAVSLRQKEAQLGQQLGKEFSAWFYERLNTLTDFAVTHFWPECNFRLELVFANQPDQTCVEETIGNGEASCAKLKDLVSVRQLYFNPNTLGHGIRGYLNPHGLAQVMVCGTIHQKESGNPVGVFEQMFGLMKDPRLGNNYKIKFSVLRMREGSHLAIQGSPPELLDSTLVGIIEEVDDD